MTSLDSLEEIKKLDRGNVLGSIEHLGGQVEQAWKGIKELAIPEACSLAHNVIICGMGGSALGGRIIKCLSSDRIRTPIEFYTDFHVPNYVNKNTLVILSSYSGNTQETLAAGKQALVKKS